uniref:EPM2A-interacting protein 1-like n=1 Tax=Styela clava TaxID=7725 RepID=UPI00193A8015|nr:EPM2A-interacting protein 1-like [Styela clava]
MVVYQQRFGKVCYLLELITAFLKEKGKCYPRLENDEWLQDLMFFTDIMGHLKTHNLALQSNENIISDLAQTVFSFQNKIKVFQRDLLTRTFSHFPKRRLTACPETILKESKLDEYKDKMQELLENFETWFNDFKELKPCFSILRNPFTTNVIDDGCPLQRLGYRNRAN